MKRLRMISPKQEVPEVLDLSKRRDSVETRNTPSPYNTSKSNDDSPQSRSPEREFNRAAPNFPANMMYDIRYASMAGLAQTPEYNQSLNQSVSPIRDSSVSPLQNLPPQFIPYPPPTLSPFLLQSAATIQQELQARMLKNDDLKAMFEPKRIQEKQPTTTVQQQQQQTQKLMRPFKLYPQNPLCMLAFDGDSNSDYLKYKQQMLEQIRTANGGQATVSNPRMRRSASKTDVSLESKYQSNDCESNSSADTTTTTARIATPDLTNNNNNNNNDKTASKNVGEKKDPSYYERRRKNNAAAKKSRDRRRQKEDDIAIRNSFLERRLLELEYELAAVRKNCQCQKSPRNKFF